MRREYDIERPVEVRDTDEDTEIQVQRAQVEQTRSDLSETVDAIREKLSPDHMAQQAKETMREKARETAEQVRHKAQETVQQVREQTQAKVDQVRHAVSDAADTTRETALEARSAFTTSVRRNPLPAALIGIGAGWLMYNAWKEFRGVRMDGRYLEECGPTYETGAYGSPCAFAYEESVGDRPGGAIREARHKLEEVQERTGEAIDEARHKASDLANRARSQAQELKGRAQQQASRVRSRFETTLHENPLSLGMIAMGIGAVIGLLIPESQKERELMGESRDRLMEKAQQKAEEIGGKVKSVAQGTVECAKEEARNQGLAA